MERETAVLNLCVHPAALGPYFQLWAQQELVFLTAPR